MPADIDPAQIAAAAIVYLERLFMGPEKRQGSVREAATSAHGRGPPGPRWTLVGFILRSTAIAANFSS